MKPSSMTEVSSQESVSDDVKTCATNGLDVLAHPESEPHTALQHSTAASKYLHQEDYDSAMRSYRQALHLYEQEDSTVGQCNAAATLHNMALLHKRCQRYTMAVRCFEEAENIYRSVYSQIVPREGEDEEGVCLEYLLIETLHNRAFLHSKYQDDVSRAIQCHEQAVETLLKEDDEELSSLRPISNKEDDVVFIKLNNTQRVKLLVESLKNLGVFYSQRGEVEGALGAFEEALEFCRSKQVSDEEISESMATVYIHLASVYFEQEDFAEALDNLQQAMNVWILRKEQPSHPEVLATINNMGLAHERMGNLDKALECYEDLLHVRSQFFGQNHVEVADSLSIVAKALERQGNTEGALDLYQEAVRIYKQASIDQDASFHANAAELTCRIASLLLEDGQVEESIDKYQEALRMETSSETAGDTATIYHGLGRAYMAKHEFLEAKTCLLKAARLLEAVSADEVQVQSLMESSEMLKQALQNESYLSSDGTWVNSEICISKTPERLAVASIGACPIGESSLSNENTSRDESQHLSSQSSQLHLPLTSSPSLGLHLSALPSTSLSELEESALSPSPLPRSNVSLTTTSGISVGLDESGFGSFRKSPPSSPRNDAELEESALSPALTTSDISLGLDESGSGSFRKRPPSSPRNDAELEESALSPSPLPRSNASLTTSDISLGLDESGSGSFRKRPPSSPRNNAPLPLTTSGSSFPLGESGRGACRESPPSSPPSRNDAPLPLTTSGNISDLDESVRGCLSESLPRRSDAALALATSGSMCGLEEPGRGSFREKPTSSSPRNNAPVPLTKPDSSFGVDDFGRGTLSQSPPSSPVSRFVEEEFDPYSSPVSPESYGQSRTRDPGKVAVESRQASVMSMAEIGSLLRSPSDELDYESEHGAVEVTLEDFPFGATIDEPRDRGVLQYHDNIDRPIGESAPRSLKPPWNSPSVQHEPKSDPEISPSRNVLTSPYRNVLVEFFRNSAAVIGARDLSVDRVAIAIPTTSRWPGRNEIQIYRSLPADVSGAKVSTTAESKTQGDSLAKDESFGPADFEQLSRSNSDGKECLQTLVMEFSMDDENLPEPHVVRTNSTNETLTLTASEQSGRGRSGSFTSDGLNHGKSDSFTSSAHSDSDSASEQRSVSYDESDCPASSQGAPEHERRRSPSYDESDYTGSDQDASDNEQRRSHTFDESEYTASDKGLSEDENNDENDASHLSTIVDNSESEDLSSYLTTNDKTDDDAGRLHSSSLNETACSKSLRRPPAYDELEYKASDQATLEHETDDESDVHYLPTVVERTSSENACFYMSSHDTKDDDANTGLHSLSLNDTDAESGLVTSGHETDNENNAHQVSNVVDDTVSADSTSYLSNNDMIDENIYTSLHLNSLNESDHTDNDASINAGTSGGDPENRDASPRRKSPPKNALDASDQSRRMSIETHNLWWPTPPTEEGETDMSDDDTSEPLLANSTSPRKKPSSPRKAGVISPPTSRGTSPRERIAKAFGGTFRRTRRGSRLDSMPEDEEHNGPPLAMDEQSNIALQNDQMTVSTLDSIPGRPINFVALHSSSGDDNVSQITFFGDEANPARRESRGSWWWGATPDGLEGWFPVVVGAAEEFLSAQSIFDQVKSRKAERSSSDSSDDESRESDVFEDLSADETEEKEDTDNEEEEESKRGTGKTHTLQYSIEKITRADSREKTTSADSRGIKSPVMEVEEGLDNTIEPDVEDVARPSPPATKHPKGFAAGPPLAIQKRGCSSRIRPKAHKLELTLHEQIARLGANHPDVASTLTDLALLLSQAGEKDAPVKLLRETLTIWKSIGDQAAIARTLHKLGDVSSQQNQFNTALTYHREALRYERSVYGTCHLEIASTLNTIGTVHASLGEFDFAMTNHQHALHILKDCVGEDLSHPLVAQTLICIGAVYYKERNSLATIRANTDDYNTFIEAGMLDVIARAHEERGSYRMAIAFFEEKLQLLRNVEKGGMDQHEVVEALTRLGTLSRKAGVFLEALDYYEEAASIQSVLGRDQVEVAKHLLLTGTVHYHLGHFRQSLKNLTETLSILQATVGNDQQVLVAETFQRMGMVQVELCEFDSAMKAFGEALRIQSSALGMDHPATLQTRLSIAIVLMNQGELDSSIEQLTAILGTQSRVHGPKHPNLARSMYHIARAYEWKGDIETATKFYEESFFMAEDFLGHDHPIQAATLHGIADLQRQKRRYKKSLQILGSVLDIRKETLGERHIDVAMTLCSVASCQAAMGRFEDSTIFFDDALLIAKEVVGSTHLLVGQIYVAKGALFLRKCQFQEARDLIKKGLDIYIRANVVEGHPRRVEAERMLERVERDELLCV